MSFKDLKKQSSLGSLTNKLVKEVEKMNNILVEVQMNAFGNQKWTSQVMGMQLFCFLPAPEGEDLPWVKLFSHAFQGPGGWYIENSLTTVGGKDPVGELNRELWNSGNESDKDTVRKKVKLSFYANIYVVKDPANPQNEGGVFLYKFGKKIFDKIMAAMQPEFEDETPINPFDFWQGANFKLKLKKVAGYWNYDSSEFDRQGPLLDDDDALEAIWKKQYSLAAFTAADQFKSYDELKKCLDYVLGKKSTRPAPQAEETEYDNTQQQNRSLSQKSKCSGSFEDSYQASKTPDPAPTASDDDDDLCLTCKTC